jgi:hypothetical protein
MLSIALDSPSPESVERAASAASMSTGQLHKLAIGKHIAGWVQKAIADVPHIPRDELLPSANTTTADHRRSTRPTAHGNANALARVAKVWDGIHVTPRSRNFYAGWPNLELRNKTAIRASCATGRSGGCLT